MVTAGIDCGAKYTKAVVLKDGKVVGKSIVSSGFDQRASAEESLEHALREAGIRREDVAHITATGTGMKACGINSDTVTEVSADAKGIIFLFPSCRTVIDVGAEEGRAIRCDEKGKVLDFAINEKCAAGAGSFTESMARALEVKIEEIGELSLKSTNAVPMNAQCAVFAESEVVSLLHAKTPKPDIARAVHDAIASRITSMVRRVGIERDVALVGGVARNVGFVKSLKEGLGMEILLPEDPEYISAVGAAVIAVENWGERK